MSGGKKKKDKDKDKDDYNQHNQKHNQQDHSSVWMFLSLEAQKSDSAPHEDDGFHLQSQSSSQLSQLSLSSSSSSQSQSSQLSQSSSSMSFSLTTEICSALRDLIQSCVEEPSTPTPNLVPRVPRHSPSPSPFPSSSSSSSFHTHPSSPSYSPASPSPKNKKIRPTLVAQGSVPQNPNFALSSSPAPAPSPSLSPVTSPPSTTKTPNNGRFSGTHNKGMNSSLSHEDREQLRQEKATLFAKPPTTPPKKWEEIIPHPIVNTPVVYPVEDVAEVAASLKGARKIQIGRLAMLYAQELVTNEKRSFFQDVYNLVRLLLLGGLTKIGGDQGDSTPKIRSEKDFALILQPKAACVYFACQSLWHCRNVIELFDIRVLKLLFENQRIKCFDQALANHLSTIQKLQDRKKVSVPVYKPPAGSWAMLLEPSEDSKNLVEHQQHGIYVNFQKTRNLFSSAMDQSERSVERGADYRSRIVLNVGTLMRDLAEENLRKFATFFKDSLLATLESSPSLRNLEQRLSHNTAQGRNALIFTSQETFYADFIHAADRHKFNSLLLLIFSEELQSAVETRLLENDGSGNRDSMLSKIFRLKTISKFYSFVKYGTFWVGEFPPPFIDNQLLHSSLGTHSLTLVECLARSHEQKTLILNLPWILEFLKVIFLRDNSSRLYLSEALGLSRAVNILVSWHFNRPLTALGSPKETRLAIFSLLSQIGDLLPSIGHDNEPLHAETSRLFRQEVSSKLGFDDCEYAKENLLEMAIPEIPALVTLLAENKVVLPKNRKVLPTPTQKIPAAGMAADQMPTLESWFFWQTPGQKVVAEVVSERVVKGTNSVEEIEKLAKQLVKNDPLATFPQIQEKISGALQGLFDHLFAARIKTGVEALSPPDLHPEVVQNTCGFALKLGFSYLKESTLIHMEKEVFRANVNREQQRLVKQPIAEVPKEIAPDQEIALRVDSFLKTYGASPTRPEALASLDTMGTRIQQALPALLKAPPAAMVSFGTDLAHLLMFFQSRQTNETAGIQSQVITLWDAAFNRDKTLSFPIRQLLNASFQLDAAGDKPTILMDLLVYALRKGYLSPTKLIESRLEFHSEFLHRPWGSQMLPALDSLEHEAEGAPFPPETFAALRSAWRE